MLATQPIQRFPPPDVRHALRKEVGYGCPVQGCGCPYLTYHHFDPPWAKQPHHNSSGMIAMCRLHHDQADAGAFTKEELREMKQRPNLGVRKGTFNWRRKRLVFKLGGGTYYAVDVVLRVGQWDMIWFSHSEGYESLNFDLFDEHGWPIFMMRENGWVVFPRVSDMETPPSGNSLKVRSRSHGVALDLKFKPAESNDDVAICEMKGKLRWPRQVAFTANGIQFPGRRGKIQGNSVHSCPVGLQIGIVNSLAFG
jgi:hypothetical protein